MVFFFRFSVLCRRYSMFFFQNILKALNSHHHLQEVFSYPVFITSRCNIVNNNKRTIKTPDIFQLILCRVSFNILPIHLRIGIFCHRSYPFRFQIIIGRSIEGFMYNPNLHCRCVLSVLSSKHHSTSGYCPLSVLYFHPLSSHVFAASFSHTQFP